VLNIIYLVETTKVLYALVSGNHALVSLGSHHWPFICAKAAIALADLSHHNSLCLSIYLSHRWISQKHAS